MLAKCLQMKPTYSQNLNKFTFSLIIPTVSSTPIHTVYTKKMNSQMFIFMFEKEVYPMVVSVD